MVKNETGIELIVHNCQNNCVDIYCSINPFQVGGSAKKRMILE
jgi:hypothetical protein